MTTSAASDRTEVGNYFIANYPPFSVWKKEAVETDARPALAAPATDVPLGLYLHIPFCRKRCHFCYFRVYTDKNASEVQTYLDVLAREWELYSAQPAIAGRPLNFVYFGGGTPSYISTAQLESLVRRMDKVSSWRSAEEITFECEPGTLTEGTLRALRNIGVTRLSLGVENFDDAILEANGRAHRSGEIGRSYDYAQSLGFPQINIDLIAGMLGETDENWTACVARTIDMAPDSVTIYQMELPFNTTISRNLLSGANAAPSQVAGWATKRRWVEEAFEALERAGYSIGSAYTAVKSPGTKFVYRDRRRVVRPHQRRAHAEPRYLRGLLQRNRGRHDSAGARPAADPRRADDPGVRAAVEAGIDPPVLFRVEVRRGCRGSLPRAARRAGRRGTSHDRSRSRDAHPRGPIARRQLVASVLQTGACDGQIHLTEAGI
jgi:oxygen-independent coproporphyrinogen-3 oxidase